MNKNKTINPIKDRINQEYPRLTVARYKILMLNTSNGYSSSESNKVIQQEQSLLTDLFNKGYTENDDLPDEVFSSKYIEDIPPKVL